MKKNKSIKLAIVIIVITFLMVGLMAPLAGCEILDFFGGCDDYDNGNGGVTLCPECGNYPSICDREYMVDGDGNRVFIPLESSRAPVESDLTRPRPSHSLNLTGGGDFNDGLHIYFLDVGQADAVFIAFPNGETMLIDAGRWNYTTADFRTQLQSFFPNGRIFLDWFIVTHCHADHIGGAQWVTQNAYIMNIIRPITFATHANNNEIAAGAYRQFGLSSEGVRGQSTATMANFVNGMNTATWYDGKATNIDIPRAGNYFEIGGAIVTFYTPTRYRYGTAATTAPNYYSTIFCIYFEGRRIVFTGDAYTSSENRVLEQLPRNIDILDIGHHGSNTSSGRYFLQRLNPRYAIIQVGTPARGNSHGHPHNVVLNRIETYTDATILRTDQHGKILVQICRAGESKQVRPLLSAA